MALRFRRSIKIAPGLRLNFGKRGFSLSAGVRGASITVGPNGTYSNIGIPGTGLSYRSRISGDSHRRAERQQQRIEKYYQRLERQKFRQEALSNITLTLDKETGKVQIQNAFGKPLSSNDMKLLWSQKGTTIFEWLGLQAEEINGDMELLLRIHEDTPSPDSEPEYEIASFDEAPPSQPRPPEDRSRPEPVILPALGFFARFFKSKREAYAERQQKLYDEFIMQTVSWKEDRIKEQTKYQNKIKAYELAMEQWKDRKIKHEANEVKKKEEFSSLLRIDSNVMDSILENEFNSLSWPRETIVSYQIVNDGREVWLDVDLPEVEHLPTKIASIGSTGRRLNIKNKPQRQLQLEYATHVHGIAFRLAGTVFAALPAAQFCVVSGYSQRINRSTGKISDEYLFSSKVDRERFSRIEFNSLDKVNPVDAMLAFETRCKMTTAGIFRVIEPFQPDDA